MKTLIVTYLLLLSSVATIEAVGTELPIGLMLECQQLKELKWEVSATSAKSTRVIDDKGESLSFPEVHVLEKPDGIPFDGQWYICTIANTEATLDSMYLLRPHEDI